MDNYRPSRPGMVQPKREQGIFEEGMMPPEDIDSASAMPKRKMRMPPEKVMSKMPVKKMGGGKVKGYAGGGVTRADGCVTKGHTRGAKR